MREAFSVDLLGRDAVALPVTDVATLFDPLAFEAFRESNRVTVHVR